ncbi:MAG: HAD-IIIA family hydrolase [Phycisphaeraceae bacterium]|nr:HAD-IIIA family hydrolase [Phycisphaeraceae bacterium]
MGARRIDTVFLDRDGTINTRLVGEWIVRPEQFELTAGAGEALAKLQRAGMRLIVVTNQRGIELGLLTETDLARVHERMAELLAPFGVRIDAIYFSAPAKCPRTKPEAGMLFDAQRDFPGIEFARSVMIGDAIRDIQAGEKAGCRTVLIASGDHGAEVLQEAEEKGVRADLVVRSIGDAAEGVLQMEARDSANGRR